jgi:urea carboxylase
MAEYHRFLTLNADGIAEFRGQQAEAFTAERRAWDQAGEFAGQLAS